MPRRHERLVRCRPGLGAVEAWDQCAGDHPPGPALHPVRDVRDAGATQRLTPGVRTRGHRHTWRGGRRPRPGGRARGRLPARHRPSSRRGVRCQGARHGQRRRPQGPVTPPLTRVSRDLTCFLRGSEIHDPVTPQGERVAGTESGNGPLAGAPARPLLLGRQGHGDGRPFWHAPRGPAGVAEANNACRTRRLTTSAHQGPPRSARAVGRHTYRTVRP